MTLPAGLHDWNSGAGTPAPCTVQVNDETLRDGLQSPSAIDPPNDAKLRLLHLMVELGVDAVTLGFPAIGPRMLAQCKLLAGEAARQKLPIALNCVGRTLEQDLVPIAALSQEFGVPIEAGTFIGASPARQAAEGWTLDDMVQRTVQAVRFAVREGLQVMFVTEDSTRTPPATLHALHAAAIGEGARRIVLADTTGHATPAGAAAIVQWAKASFSDVQIDWHGHRDRGLGVANCLAAAEAGADRVHATALGVGERCGNAEMDLLLVNLRLMGRSGGDLTRLPEYCRLVSHTLGMRIPSNYPVVGMDAFRTATGIHASAILKAMQRGDTELADLLYSSVPASWFGLKQRVDVSPMSGLSNVKYWLATHGHDPENAELQQALLRAAKRADRVLTNEECEFALRAPNRKATPHVGS